MTRPPSLAPMATWARTTPRRSTLIFFFHHANIDRIFWLWQKKWSRTETLDIIPGYPGTNSSDNQGIDAWHSAEYLAGSRDSTEPVHEGRQCQEGLHVAGLRQYRETARVHL